MKKDTKEVSFFIYASNEPKSMIELDLVDCLNNWINSQSVLLIVYTDKKIKFRLA